MAIGRLSMHRRRAGLAVALAGVVVPAGCSSASDTADPTSEESSVLLPPAEGTTQYPLTLRTPYGETVLEDRPERVAVIGFSPNMDALQALDVIPVFSQADDVEWPWRDPEWSSGIAVIDPGTRSEPTNFEAIAATDPDLIVTTNFVGDEADTGRLRISRRCSNTRRRSTPRWFPGRTPSD